MIEYLPKFYSNEEEKNKKLEMLKAIDKYLESKESKKLLDIRKEVMVLKDTYSINYDIKIINSICK